MKPNPSEEVFFLRDFIASFRNVCSNPPVEMRFLLREMNRLRNLLTAARSADETIDKNGYVVG